MKYQFTDKNKNFKRNKNGDPDFRVDLTDMDTGGQGLV